MALYKGKIPVITRSLNEGWLRGQGVESFGCVPRDYAVDPVEMRDSPDQMQLVPEADYQGRWEADEANETSLEHLFTRGGVPAFQHLDQGQFPDCWAHSTAHDLMLGYLIQNLPVPTFNGVAVATMLGRTNGGWSGLSMKFGRDNGYPVTGTGPGQWPKWTRNQKYDTPELRADMLRHKVTEDWYDLGRDVWDQGLSKRQLHTCSFNNHPMALDFNRFGHAMACLRVVQFEPGAWGPLVLNSWDGWGWNGLGVLAEIWPDSAVALRTTTPSV